MKICRFAIDVLTLYSTYFDLRSIGRYTPTTELTSIHTLIGKYTALLAVLVVGSFVIPMAQYFWYVRDDDSSDKFFAEDVPEPPQKKKWF